jgi:hypothetical protein
MALKTCKEVTCLISGSVKMAKELREHMSIKELKNLEIDTAPQNNNILDLYYLDFSRPQLCERTYPVSCVIKGIELFGRNWAQLLVAITEKFIADNNPNITTLYEQPLYQCRTTRPFLMNSRIEGLNCAQLSNGYWININYSIPRLVEIIGRLCVHCGVNLNDVMITYTPKSSGIHSSDAMHTASAQVSSIYDKTVNEFVCKKGLDGTTAKEISAALNLRALSAIIRLLDNDTDIIALPRGRYIHRDNVVDLDEAANVLLRILQAQFRQFDGYSNYRLLFDAARIDLSLFMNDNAFEDEETIFAIAKYLFCKKKYEGNHFIFYGNTHIWEKEPDYPLTIRGILMHQARLNGGRITKAECEEFLNKIKMSQNNFNQAIQYGSDSTFYQYDSGIFLLSETLHIDTAWQERVKQALDELFKDNAFVIPRDIIESWYNKLPELPLGLSWTPLLLQEVLRYNPAIGYKSIFAPLEQSSDTIAAAIVPIDSDIMFADVVSAYLSRKIELPKRMSAEDLRLLLREAGMVEGNELIYNMHKALDDYRFAWSDGNKTVYIIMG